MELGGRDWEWPNSRRGLCSDIQLPKRNHVGEAREGMGIRHPGCHRMLFERSNGCVVSFLN